VTRRLLDLFCCEGGAGMGYHRAGFDVTGVDNVDRSRRYPFRFVQADALEYLAAHGHEYDAVHASPPCQAYSITRHSHTTAHPELLGPTRVVLTHPEVLRPGTPWVIENVPGAPMQTPITLCGSSFGLTTTDDDGTPLVLKRHRLFESNVLLLPLECDCALYRDRGYQVAGAYGGGSSDRAHAREVPRVAGAYGGGSSDRAHAREVPRGGYTPSKAKRSDLLGVEWMTLYGQSQSLPPAYTEYIGLQLLEHLAVSA
jgi:DNA (cytosine-5)-methyltransferase 1